MSAVKQVTPELKAASELGLLYFAKLPEPLPKKKGSMNTGTRAGGSAQGAATAVFPRRQNARKGARRLIRAMPSRIVYSVRDKSRQSAGAAAQRPSTCARCTTACSSRSEIVATFLSVLELCSMGSIHIDRREGDYAVAFVGGDVDEILEKIENNTSKWIFVWI